jgi:GNAT superfamily N-acetyltransferase
MKDISLCDAADLQTIFDIINESALAYKGVIPPEAWHEPYMPMEELISEIRNGVTFYGYRVATLLVAVIGVQDIKDVTLIRHAYVRTAYRGQGIGGKVLTYLNQVVKRPVLIGTWKAATWAVRFYEKNGFVLLGSDETNRLLKIYWTVPDRQIEASVVLADQRWRDRANLQSLRPSLPSL